jgi:hypothetical protein
VTQLTDQHQEDHEENHHQKSLVQEYHLHLDQADLEEEPQI